MWFIRKRHSLYDVLLLFFLGYPEETYPVYDISDCIKHRQETILVDYPDPKEPSAEEIAERMAVLEEEESDPLDWEVPSNLRSQEDSSVTSYDPKPETCSYCFHEEDPAVLVENSGFTTESHSEQEEATREIWPHNLRDEGWGTNTDEVYVAGTLRKRTPQDVEGKSSAW